MANKECGCAGGWGGSCAWGGIFSFSRTSPVACPRNMRPTSPSSTTEVLPLEWPDRVDARNDVAEVHLPCDQLRRGLHSAPPNHGNLPRLARGSGRPGHLL